MQELCDLVVLCALQLPIRRVVNTGADVAADYSSVAGGCTCTTEIMHCSGHLSGTLGAKSLRPTRVCELYYHATIGVLIFRSVPDCIPRSTANTCRDGSCKQPAVPRTGVALRIGPFCIQVKGWYSVESNQVPWLLYVLTQSPKSQLQC